MEGSNDRDDVQREFRQQLRPPTQAPPTLARTPSPTREFSVDPQPITLTDTHQEPQTSVFNGLKRRTTAQVVPLIDSGHETEFLAEAVDPDTELECIDLAYPVAEGDVQATVRGLANPSGAQGSTFKDIRDAVNSPPSAPHPLAVKALTNATREEHRRVLNLIRLAPTNFDNWPAEKGLLEVLASGNK